MQGRPNSISIRSRIRVWGIVGLLLEVIIATQLVFWEINLGPWFSFGRLRSLHTNAVILAFVGNGMFAGIYHFLRDNLILYGKKFQISSIPKWRSRLIEG